MNRSLFLRVLMVAGIAMAFAAGHQVAKISAANREREGGLPKNPPAGSGDISSGHGKQDPADARSWQDVKQQIVKQWAVSPAMSVDFELREKTTRLLEKTPVADLEAWMKELRGTKWTDEEEDVAVQLRRVILMVLAQRGGGNFVRSLAEHPMEDGEYEFSEAIKHWTQQDPVAVLDWLDGPVPQVMEDDRDFFRKDALEILAGRDPAEFERRLAKVDVETREDVLEDYARRRGTAEGRDALLARATDSPHGEAMALWSGLLGCEGADDPMRAYATLKELDISPEDRAKLDEGLVYSLLYPSMISFLYREEKIDGTGVMQAWMERNPGDQVSKSVLDSFGDWSKGNSEPAANWVSEQPSGPRHDAFAKLLIEQRFDDYKAIARLVVGISDPATRATIQHQLKDSWQKKDATAAAEWERTLPEEDRERLK